MAAVEDKIRQLQQQISAVQGKKIRAAVDLDTAKDRLEAAKTVLERDFGVKTTAEAKEKLESLRAELTDSITHIEKQLSDAGAA